MASTTRTSCGSTILALPNSESLPSIEKSEAICDEISGNAKPPTKPEELGNLLHVRDRIPLSVWLVIVLAGLERFAYYGLTTPFQNFIQNSRAEQLRPGALGLGQNTATTMIFLFGCFISLASIACGIIADKWLGRYRVLLMGFSIYGAGGLILSITVSPGPLKHGAGLGGLIAAMLFIAIGVGCTSSNMVAFSGDQYTRKGHWVEARENNKQVVVEGKLTIEAIFNFYYWAINIGSLSGIATTFMEKYVSFWTAFLLPSCALGLALLVLLFGRSRFSMQDPKGSVLPDAAKAAWLAMKGGFTWSAARPEFQSESFSLTVPWDDNFIDELKQASTASCIFLLWPVLWVCRIQFNTNLVSQAGQMRTYGIPNDLMFYTNAVTVIILIPLVDKFIYPRLRQSGLELRILSRITIGFLFEAGAMAYAAWVQAHIYRSGPCFNFPLECLASDGGLIPNDVNVWVQTPIYLLEAFSEVLVFPAQYEFANLNAPVNMKSSMQAILSVGVLGGRVLGLTISSTYKNPHLVIVYSALASSMVITAGLFFLQYQRYEQKQRRLEVHPEHINS